MGHIHNTQHSSDLYSQAEAFMQAMAEDNKACHALENAGGIKRRLPEISAEIRKTGTYTHTADELQFGERLAWRNSNRCIGRHLWR